MAEGRDISLENFSDEEIVKKIRQEDQELFAVLIDRYQDKLLRYAVRIIRDQSLAEEVVQNAFIKVFKNLAGFNVKRRFSSWIYRIVHNEAVNIIKKRSKVLPLDEEVKNNIPADTLFPAQKMDSKIAKEKVEQCLDQLPYKYKEPIILYYLEEKSYEEISDILRIPQGTVGTRLHRGIKKICGFCQPLNINNHE